MARITDATERRRLALLLSPAYLWLMVAIFLPLSAMLFFSFVTRMPQDGPGWQLTWQNYTAFLSNPPYPALLRKSLGLALVVTGLCVVIGYPCALVLAKSIRGRAREALFLMVILPF